MAYQPTDWEHGDIITGGKLNKIEKELTHVADNATYGFGGAQLSSDGLTPLSYINAGDPMPANPQKGDAVFLKDGNDFLIYSYNGEDWVLKVDPDLSNRIEETIKTASDNTDKAIADNNTQINETINQVAKEQADLAVKDGDFNNKAQAMADKALKDAKDNTATVAKSTLDTANKNIADAKKSLTDNIAKEVSDRASAVSALDTKAQGYADDANKSATDGIAQEAKDRATAVSTVDKSAKGYADQAKQDAVDVATSADGVINKKIDDTASSLTSTISQNKIDANGKISTAQSTATQALNGLSTKVEKTEYDKKTGDLTTQLNTTTATATQSKQDIVDIKSTNSSQNSKINSIVSDATKTQQTISDIQKSQSTQSDKLNQITTDVNGTKQEITDIKTKDGQQDTRMGTIETSVSGVKSDFSTYKTDANGRISTAQTTAQTAVDGLKTKVSQTDYNAKTGQLSTDVTNVTQTANQAKTDIASIKQTDTKQDARMTTIAADANGTKTTVSNLQKTQNTQSGSISTLQQRADGFDATVTKVNGLSVGARNLIIGSKQLNWNTGLNTATTMTKVDYDSTTKTWHITSPKGGSGNCGLYFGMTANSSRAIAKGEKWSFSLDVKGTGDHSQFGIEGSTSFNKYTGSVSSDWTRVSSTGVSNGSNIIIIYFSSMNNAVDVYVKLPKLETGNIATDWTPAPEDVDSATAKAQLTADQATTSLNNYKTDADGRITKAQSDITQTVKDVTTKVSQSDYNAKTGDLSTSVSKAQQTADSAVTTIGNYKTSNDNRVKATETSVAQNTKDITLRATTSDLDSAKKDYNAQIAQVKVNADSITSQVSSIQAKINSMGQVNQLANTEFNPDYSGWYTKYPNPTAKDVVSTQFTNVGTDGFGSNMVSHKGNGSWIASSGVPVAPGMKLSFSARFFAPKAITSGGTPIALYIMAYDANGNRTLSNGYNVPVPGLSVSSNTYKLQNVTIPDKSVVAYAIFAWNVTDEVYISQPMLVFGSTVGDYVSGAYNSNDKVALQQITLDGITDTVSKQGTNIDSVTKRVTTAEGTLSTATNNISGLQSSVTQTSNQIKTEITDRTKGDSNTLQSSKDFTTSSITSYDKGVQTQLTQTANGMLAQVESTNMVVNSEFDPLNGTFYRLTNGGSAGSQLAEAWSATQATGFADWPVVNGSRVVSYAVGTWYSSALVSTSAGKAFSASIVAGRSPAPTVSTALDYRIGFWDSSRKLLSTASAGNIIDGTAYKGIQKYVVENKIAPANTAFVSVIIAHSSANATDYITRPSLNTGAKASPYTPTYGTSSSSTVLSLFKDNWAIGITDNISKITSGIVGNASQMSLISKNVTIDSPNTQIKGTAWIQSAMIANGAIGSAQIGDATITSAKIATLDVAKLTGNVSNFIQSNWNGLYQSVKISPIGMTISTSQGSTAQFNQDGLVLEGALGTTNVLNGQIELISSKNEYLGTFQHETMPDHDNVDYLMIKLAGWHTGKSTDPDYDLNSDGTNTIRGGDGIGFGVTNSVGTYDMKMSWDSSLVAGYKGRKAGWHVEDIMTWHQPTYFEGGFDVAQQFSSTDRRALHIQGATLSNGHKWFGFFDTPSKAGFGTDDTNDVLFYMKGKSYSLYTMLSKLNML
ncbi:hypothetical protein [Leuconostoc mesenteroides]|uniref:hypothetical protein n=1 Tax=Leuconostoc mesenteroides TaxID=1245 RepID=UPI001364010F|nr:hypothetical protein [Leuconostoc mesenteroides]QHM55723.1 Chromosome partition protein Smc [Leuconostoc mesenteroides]